MNNLFGHVAPFDYYWDKTYLGFRVKNIDKLNEKQSLLKETATYNNLD